MCPLCGPSGKPNEYEHKPVRAENHGKDRTPREQIRGRHSYDTTRNGHFNRLGSHLCRWFSDVVALNRGRVWPGYCARLRLSSAIEAVCKVLCPDNECVDAFVL